MPKFSVIVPVYNAEKYLNGAIGSILRQGYKDFELIIIDDGSSDNSSKICEEYAAVDYRIRYIKQENSGICASRNKGIDVACGEYIVFSDDDDYMEPDCLKKLNDIFLENSDVDVVKSSYEQWWKSADNGITRKKVHVCNENFELIESMNISEFLALREAGIFNVIWNGAYRREFIINNGLKFEEKIKFGGEDNLFNLRVIEQAKRIYYIKDSLYRHYVIQKHSTSLKFSTNRIDSVRVVCAKELLFYEASFSKKDALYYYGKNKILASHILVILNFLNHNDSDLTKKEKIRILKEVYEEDGLQFEGWYPSSIRNMKRLGAKSFALWLYQLKMFELLNLFCKIVNKTRIG